MSTISSSSAWATVENGACPSGKSSCMEVDSLLATSDGGQTWSQVNLTPVSTSWPVEVADLKDRQHFKEFVNPVKSFID